MADKVLTRPDKRYEVQPTLAYISPEAETVKHRAEVGTAYLDFQVGKYAILPDFRNNALELAKIDNTISTVVNDKNITLEGIILKGFASPEGSYKSNTVLAGNRVKALAEYIRKKHDFKPELFTLDNGSEDWEGLKAKVEADRSVPSREAVLAIINSNDEAGQERRQAGCFGRRGSLPLCIEEYLSFVAPFRLPCRLSGAFLYGRRRTRDYQDASAAVEFERNVRGGQQLRDRKQGI